jgi:hypothetical protein
MKEVNTNQCHGWNVFLKTQGKKCHISFSNTNKMKFVFYSPLSNIAESLSYSCPKGSFCF